MEISGVHQLWDAEVLRGYGRASVVMTPAMQRFARDLGRTSIAMGVALNEVMASMAATIAAMNTAAEESARIARFHRSLSHR